MVMSCDDVMRVIIRMLIYQCRCLCSHFYRKENSLPTHIEFMNAVAKFDVGLGQLGRKVE